MSKQSRTMLRWCAISYPTTSWSVSTEDPICAQGVVLMVPWWMRTVVPWALALILGGSARDTSSNSAALRRKRRK